jgi:hypothetical protein
METKRKYIKPRIEWIPLDSEIALQLESTPPSGPGEAKSKVPEYFNNDPYKINTF